MDDAANADAAAFWANIDAPPGHTPASAAAEGALPAMALVAAAEGAEWAQPVVGDGDESVQHFTDKAIKAMKLIATEFGGPLKYLESHLANSVDQESFSSWLYNTFTEKDDLFCHHDFVLPWVRSGHDLASSPPVVVNIAALGFGSAASLKPDAGTQLFEQLVEQYLSDGFVTNSEPLLVTQPSEMQVGNQLTIHWTSSSGLAMNTQSLGYVKGNARTSSALALLHWVFANGLDMLKAHPTLFDSFRAIYVHPYSIDSKLDEAMLNTKLSDRGSIRKATNIIQTVILIQNVNKYGNVDIGAFTRKWDSQTGRSSQIIGKRAASLKLLLETAPRDTLLKILSHVGRLGFENSCWTDDNLSFKKMYPLHQFPTKHKKWVSRIRTSEKSFDVMITRVHAVFEASPLYMRRKLDSATLEAMAERSACLLALAKDLKPCCVKVLIHKDYNDQHTECHIQYVL